jgi:hypothetical protein
VARPAPHLPRPVADALPVTVLAVIAGAGSFTHTSHIAAEHGQHGPMSWAVAVCIDLTCVMAAAFLVAVSMIERSAAAEHQDQHGQPITRDQLRARFGVSNQATSELLRQLRSDQGHPPGTSRAA